jgi:3-deoxy-7-phosphoheptulonate synthase
VIVVMRSGASPGEIDTVERLLEARGFDVARSEGARQCVLGALGDRAVDVREFELLPGVERVVPLSRPYRLAAREARPEGTVVELPGHAVGGPELVVMAGPCSVESEAQVCEAARAVRDAGATILRGGAFKPRSSPYSFQGLGEEGLRLLRAAADSEGLGLVTEVLEPAQVRLVAEWADILQVGARNMQNFPLLKELGRTRKPVLLKRGLSATIEDWLLSAEYILHGGNSDVILCERGIRTFETATRNTLDLSAVPVVKRLSHLPIVVDPSHATGYRDLVRPMARAAVAAGADGLLLEVHPDPATALSDGPQSLDAADFRALMDDVRRMARALDRPLAAPRIAVLPE